MSPGPKKEDQMIRRSDILYMGYLKKSEFTGSHQGMRYRLEGVSQGEEKKLQATVWPEPYNYVSTPEEQKRRALFDFSEAGVDQAVDWMNRLLEEERELWAHSSQRWDEYSLD